MKHILEDPPRNDLGQFCGKAIANKMALIQSEFPVVTKDRRVSGGGASYSYRGIDDALRVLNPLLSKHRVFMRPCFTKAESVPCTTSGGKPAFHTTVHGELYFQDGDSGECVSVSMVGEGMDNADKGTMKAQANALKYALWYTFCVPTEEKKDSEAFDG